jgi:hypothetical protein
MWMEPVPLLKRLTFATAGDLGYGAELLNEGIIDRLIERQHAFLDQHQAGTGAGEER